jgi:hypothetical protein
VLDNLNLHKGFDFDKVILDLFVNNPVIVLRTPVHGSALNKIENIWNLMKRRLSQILIKQVPVHEKKKVRKIGGVDLGNPETYLFNRVNIAMREACPDDIVSKVASGGSSEVHKVMIEGKVA